MKKISFLILAFTLIMLSGMVGAEEINSVVLASEENYPDALVAGVAANKIGAPLLLTKPDQLPNETKEEIESLNISTIYIVGGPYAISEELENELAENYEVVRLWGMTRFGTSAEVAEYFWQESSKAILVWDVLGLPEDGNSEIVAKARDLAQANDAPLLLIPKNVLPEAVSDALINLSVQEVILVGNIGSQVESDLTEMGINITDRIPGGPEEVEDGVRERVINLLHGKRPLVVIAIGNWSDPIKAPYRPNGTSRHITSESQIDTLIEEINQNNYTRIIIVGKPALAQAIYDRLAQAGINSTLISGRAAKTAREIMRMDRDIIRLRVQLHKLSRSVSLLLRKTENLENRAGRFVNALNATIRRLEQLMVRLNGTAILEKAEQLRERIRDEISLRNYENALLVYKILENQYDQLRLRNITNLREELRNIISSEKVRPILIRRIRGR